MIMLKNKVSIRYIKWLIPILFILLFALGSVIFLIERNNVISYNEELGKNITSQIGTALKIWIQDQIAIVKMIAQEPVIIEACINPHDMSAVSKAQKYTQMIHQRYPFYENVPLAVKLKPEESILINIDDQIKTVHNGQFILDTVNNKTVGKGGLQYSYIKAAFEGNEYFISEVYPSILRGNPIFVISAPVKKDGVIVGAAIISPQMAYFTDLFVKNKKIGKTGYLFLFDDRSMFISHPEKSFILNKDMIEKVQPISTKAFKGENQFESSFEGISKKYISYNVDISPSKTKHQWYVASTQNMDEIIKNAITFLKILLIAGFIFFFIISIAIVIITHFIFAKPIKSASDAAHRLANYDLTVEIKSYKNDEISQLIKEIHMMVNSFRKIVSMISQTSMKVNSSTNAISSAVSNQASVASQQSASVSEITSTMAELSASFTQIAENADTVTKIAENSLQNTKQGADAVVSISNKMDEINRDNLKNIQEIKDLGKKTREITKVMAIINNIADQTKLIAFNAALEASGAGEAGKRFGVVASEIRRLANSVTESTDEIEYKINEIQQAVNHMTIGSEKNSKSIQEGLEYSTQTNQKLMDIVEGSQATVNAAKQISLSTRQQQTASEQVVNALREIDQGTEQTSSAINNLSTTSNDLARLSENLQNLVNKFKLDNNQ